MDYGQTVDFLFSLLPNYQNQGSSALNLKLDKVLDFLNALDNPQENFKSIHVGGTNGKGTTSHIIAAVLSQSGYNVGLYTSPHLKSFRERIKVDQREIDEAYIVDFVQLNKHLIEELKPSFFEITVVLAFKYFADCKVDLAVIEVGLGGRYDATNVLKPILSIITNISLDHQDFLGDTIQKIAFEKAGIIKKDTPVVIGEFHNESFPVFEEVSRSKSAPLIKAFETDFPLDLIVESDVDYIKLNKRTAFSAISLLKDGFDLGEESIKSAFLNFTDLWALKGRWQKLSDNPLIICDTGHNKGGVDLLKSRINKMVYQKLYVVWGMVKEKDVEDVLLLLPKEAEYLFTEAKNSRSMKAEQLCRLGISLGLKGKHYTDVGVAIKEAKKKASKDDFILIGGSNFVVAEIEEL